MGCICSKGSSEEEAVEQNKEEDFSMASVQLVAPASSKRDSFILEVSGVIDGSSKASYGSVHKKTNDEQDSKTIIVERPVSSNHQRRTSLESRKRPEVSRMLSMRRGPQGEQAIPGWPSWLTSVAADAIKGWIPRRAESFEKFDKIGQGTYSTVYKARDLETGKIVALKKVRFTNMDPESVRFMAREIYILRRLDHPNVMKLEGIVTSRISCSLYLVFEYMEHDLSGLIARGIKFTESQVKCYMQQLLRGLEHCHSRGVLHRDIKGSNLLIDGNGVLKIGDFGLANVYEQNQTLTSRVVTLWYRAPELLLGATEYGPAVDLWSAGCILAELLAAKPIMPGRTEVEQMHKIFKLCGSPAEDYWQRTKLPHATSFKPQQPYKRRLSETYKDFPPSAMSLLDKLLAIEPEKRGSASSALQSELFTTDPLPCDPSSLPKYPPSKELDAKIRDEEARRTRADNMKGQGAESLRRGPNVKVVPHEVRNISVQAQPKTASHKYIPQEDCGSGFLIDPPRGARQNGYSHSRSVMHPSAVGSSWNKTVGSTRDKPGLSKQTSQRLQPTTDLKKDDIASGKESGMGYVPKKNRIQYSGPLMPPGGNMEDMLKEHERQIQQAVRKARLDKNRNQ